MVWVAHEVVLIALANGYVVLVSALLLMRQRKNASATAHGRAPEESPPVPVTAKSMSTTRIFQNYLTAAIELEGSPAVLGDTSLKVLSVDMAKWGTDGCLSMWVERSELSTRLTHPACIRFVPRLPCCSYLHCVLHATLHYLFTAC